VLEIRTAVIGVGYLGKFHAQKYAQLKNSKLVAVVDANFEQAEEIAAANNCQALADYEQLLGKVDAVSIAVPTDLHYQVAAEFLRHGCHVLVDQLPPPLRKLMN